MRPHTLFLLLSFALFCGAISLAQTRADPASLLADGTKLLKAGQLDEAVAVYEKAAALAPDSFEAQLALGRALDLKGSFEPARTHLGKAVELATPEERARALMAMGVSFAFERKASDAARHYQRLLDIQMEAKAYSDAAATANALGRLYLESGDTANARKWYETGYETARRQADLPGPQLDLWQLRWEHAQARIAARRGDAAEAARHAQAVRAIVEKGGENEQQRPVYNALEGYINFYGGDSRAAIAWLLKADETDVFALGMLGQAYERVNEPRNARDCYRKVMAILQHDLQVAFTRPLAGERLKALGPG